MRKLAYSLMVALLLIGCSKQVNLYIIGGPERFEYPGIGVIGGTGITVMCDPIASTVTVDVNGKAIEEISVYEYSFEFRDTVVPTPGTDYKLGCNTNIGNASATVKMPGMSVITAPASDSVAVGSITITWSAATYAEWYMVDLWFYDTGYVYKDTLIPVANDTSLTVSDFCTTDGWLNIGVDAVVGPVMEAGAKGNIDGAKGFWLGVNGTVKAVIVGAPVFSASGKPCINHIDLHKRYLKALAPFSEEAAEILEIMN